MQLLELSDFKIGIITMLYDIKVNKPGMSENIKIHGRGTENVKRWILDQKNRISKIKYSLDGLKRKEITK